MTGINTSRTMIIVLLIIIVIFAVIIINVNCPICSQPQQSHLLQNPADHVVLSREYHVGGCGSQESDFFRIYPDGTKDDTPFRVPERRLLVVTDVDWWLADFREPNSPGYTTYFTLALEHKVGNLITTFRVFKDTLLNDPQDRLGRSVGMTAGFVVAPDTRICPFAQVATSNDQDRLRINAILRGYLIDGESGTAQNDPTGSELQ